MNSEKAIKKPTKVKGPVCFNTLKPRGQLTHKNCGLTTSWESTYVLIIYSILFWYDSEKKCLALFFVQKFTIFLQNYHLRGNFSSAVLFNQSFQNVIFLLLSLKQKEMELCVEIDNVN